MENKIPTAEEVWKHSRLKDGGLQSVLITTKLMIDFAKIHVEAALNKAYENAEMIEKSADENGNQPCFMSNDMGDSFILDKKSILKSYSLDNIK